MNLLDIFIRFPRCIPPNIRHVLVFIVNPTAHHSTPYSLPPLVHRIQKDSAQDIWMDIIFPSKKKESIIARIFCYIKSCAYCEFDWIGNKLIIITLFIFIYEKKKLNNQWMLRIVMSFTAFLIANSNVITG